MSYIIENTLTNLYGVEHKNSYIIEGSKVIYSSKHLSKYRHFRVNTNQFVLTPGYIMIDFGILTIDDFQGFKDGMKHLQTIGCTTLITACDVQVEDQIDRELKRAKHALINSSIDYLLGVKIPLKKLTPTLVRKCCKYKVPILFTEINAPEDIHTIQWQWIRNELFPYQIMIVPIWNISAPAWKLRKLKSDWDDVLTKNKILTQQDSPSEHTPLPKQFLFNIGLYPMKGSLQVGTDADYLLFSSKGLVDNESDLGELYPDVVIANGIVKKAGSNVIMQPGCGKELIVNIPRRFNPISNAFQSDAISIDYY
ncbi:hypothetical protein H1D32_15005 [Anaerobacillus sp. CMMVII]|uniref:hypothetical protein n=1 Tax=Anaerobacillus sp. CMMVII TaxID=2755588 RepID=UPI0021B77F1B|nr:hypothetical protein [Anaerobacillus sp. CMMVII]MCT8138904.1 hypothetical protein [Anaerobacillus sp. CMMVII]